MNNLAFPVTAAWAVRAIKLSPTHGTLRYIAGLVASANLKEKDAKQVDDAMRLRAEQLADPVVMQEGDGDGD